MSDISSFLIQNPKQIINNLSLLIKNKCLLSASFGENNEFYITTLLGINEANNSVILDYGSKENLNQRILNAGKITFDAEYNGIKVSFTGASLKIVTYKKDLAFSTPIPQSLYWMQRREYFRVKSPVSKSSYFQLIMTGREPVKFKLYDISLTGFSILNVSKEISDLLVPGASFSQSKLILSEAGEVIISFEICTKYMINSDRPQKIQKIGCKFTDMTPPVEEIIQRYIQQIQRESLKKK